MKKRDERRDTPHPSNTKALTHHSTTQHSTTPYRNEPNRGRTRLPKLKNETNRKGGKFSAKRNEIFRPELKIENETNKKGGKNTFCQTKTNFLQSETKLLDQNSARSKSNESNRGKTFCEEIRNVLVQLLPF